MRALRADRAGGQRVTTTIGSLFSGIGGLDIAVAQHYGGEVVWHSEIDADAATILATRYPTVPNIGDITTVDWDTVPAVDILTQVGRRGEVLSSAFVEWMLGFPEGWTSGVPRAAALKALGNSVQPQQATYALALLDGAR